MSPHANAAGRSSLLALSINIFRALEICVTSEVAGGSGEIVCVLALCFADGKTEGESIAFVWLIGSGTDSALFYGTT